MGCNALQHAAKTLQQQQQHIERLMKFHLPRKWRVRTNRCGSRARNILHALETDGKLPPPNMVTLTTKPTTKYRTVINKMPILQKIKPCNQGMSETSSLRARTTGLKTKCRKTQCKKKTFPAHTAKELTTLPNCARMGRMRLTVPKDAKLKFPLNPQTRVKKRKMSTQSVPKTIMTNRLKLKCNFSSGQP